MTANTPSLDPKQLDQLLAAVCGSNLDLRRQIEEVVETATQVRAARNQGDAETSTSGLNLRQPAETGFDPLAEDEQVGSVIGRFTLLRKLGEGGMGTVFLAEQREPVARQVALKIIKPGMDSREVVVRFLAERQALALMDHPGIAKVYDGGLTPAGRPYFVMELVQGQPLTHYADEARLDLPARIKLFLSVCAAVQHAHQKGVIHRDLKPSNILVAGDGEPRPKVIDFGVAKALDQKLTEQTLTTAFGRIMGTFEYMSPEQGDLGTVDVDTRSDVYSLGVILYELLAGDRPLNRKDHPNLGLAQLLHLLQTKEPPPPSRSLAEHPDMSAIATRRRTDPGKLERQLHGELDWIILKALEKDRSRRYATVQELASDLGRYLKNEPVSAGPPSASYRAKKFLRRHYGKVGAAAALLAVLLAGVAGTTWGWLRSLEKEAEAIRARDNELKQKVEAEKQRDAAARAEKEANKQRDAARAAEQTAKEQAQIATAVNRFLLQDLLGEADPEKNPRHRQVTVESLVDRAAKRVTDSFSRQPHLEAALRQTIGSVYRVLGNYPASQPHLQRAWEIHERTLPPAHPDRILSRFNLASLAYAQGRFAESEAIHKELLQLVHEHPEVNPQTILEIKGSLGQVLQAQAKFKEAEPLLQECLEGWERLGGPLHKETMGALNNLGLLRWREQRYSEAQRYLEQAKAIADQALGYELPLSLNVLSNLGLVYRFQNKMQEAEKLYLQAWEARKRVLGEEHQETLVTAGNLALLWKLQGRFSEAEKLLRETLEGCRKHLGPVHPQTIKAVNNLAATYTDQRKFAPAFELLEEIYDLAMETLPKQEPDRWVIARNHEVTGYMLKEYAKIEKSQREVLNLERAKPKPDAKVLAAVAGRLAEHLFREKRYADALEPLEETCRLRAEVAPTSISTQGFRVRYGICLNEARRYAEAIPPLEAAVAGLRETQNLNTEGKAALAKAYEELVKACQGAGRSADAEKWRAELDKLAKPPTDEPPTDKPAADKP